MKKKLATASVVIIGLIVIWGAVAMVDVPFERWFEELRSRPVLGLGLYTLISFLAIVAAPLGTLALVPLASGIWGWMPVLIFSLFAWQLGAVFNYWIAHRYGRVLLGRFVDLRKLDALIVKVSGHQAFWDIVLLRMALPVDVTSYALGLSPVKFGTYFRATLLGMIPFAAVISYGGSVLDSWTVVPALALGLLLVLVASTVVRRRHR